MSKSPWTPLGTKLFDKPDVPDSVKSPSNVQSHHKSIPAFFQGVLPVLGEEETEEVCSGLFRPETKLPV